MKQKHLIHNHHHQHYHLSKEHIHYDHHYNHIFTPNTMKITGIVIISLDIFLLLIWFAGAIYNISQLDKDICYTEIFIVHFLILIHFALGMCISNIIDAIMKEEKEIIEKRESDKLMNYYTPLTWIFTSIVSTFGDAILLAYAIRSHIIVGDGDICKPSRILHITYDVVAVLISLTSVIWFIVFAFYTLDHKKQKEKQHHQMK